MRAKWLGGVGIAVCGALVLAWTMRVSAQDLNTRLMYFLNDLVSGALGVQATITTVTATSKVMAPTFDVAAAGALNVGAGTPTATQINLNADTYLQNATFLRWPSLGKMRSAADGVFALYNNAGTTGASLNVATDGLLAVRNTANNADASLSAASATLSAVYSNTPSTATVSHTGVAIPLTSSTCAVTTDGDSDLDNGTLANGTTSGQTLRVYVTAVGNAADSFKVTPTTPLGYTIVTCAANPLGKSIAFTWTGAAWVAESAACTKS